MSTGSINCRNLGVDLSSWVSAGLDCRCGILYALCCGVVIYAELVSLTSSSYPSPYSLELFVLDGRWSTSRVLLCVRVRRLGAFGFLPTLIAQRNYILHNANRSAPN